MTVRELQATEIDAFAVMVAAAKGRDQRVDALGRHMDRGGVFLVAEDQGAFVGGIKLHRRGDTIEPVQPYIPAGPNHETIFEALVPAVILYMRSSGAGRVEMHCDKMNRDLAMVRRCLEKVRDVAAGGSAFDITEAKDGDDLIGVDAVYVDQPA